MGGQDAESLVSKLKQLSIEDKKKLIAVMLLTDGYIAIIRNHPKISYYGSDKILHDIFKYLINSTYNTSESNFYWRNFSTDYFKKENMNIYEDMYKLSSSFRSNSKESTVSFLFGLDRDIKILAIQLAMAAEGSISISRRDTGTRRGDLALACTSPTMCNEWKKLFEEFNIHFKIKKNKLTSTGLHGLQAIRQESIKNFYKNINFLPQSYANRARRFKGKEKRNILKMYCDFIDNIAKEKFKTYTRWNNITFWEKVCVGGQ
ncbi:hypothetical protein HN510_01815 [Candidatus Woesearchaeota archaeon]|nr:hypothetical protein [Candidatus Woesearchaeota archaeon]